MGTGHDQFGFSPTHVYQFKDLLFFQKSENEGIHDFIANEQFSLVLCGFNGIAKGLGGMFIVNGFGPSGSDKRVFSRASVSNIGNIGKDDRFPRDARFHKLNEIDF